MAKTRRLNRGQRMVLTIGIILFVLQGLFPPWSIYHPDRGPHGGYCFLYRAVSDQHAPLPLDIERLGVQWAIIAVLTLGTMWLRQTDERKRHDNDV